jgi:general secretion pathway protein G
VRAPRAELRAGGFSLLELAVALALISVFSAFLLDRFLFYQEAAEKAEMEYTANTLKVALQLRIGELMARHQVVDYAAIARENPMHWMDVPVPFYRGEVEALDVAAELAYGWYYERAQAQLVYVSRLNRHLTMHGARASRVRWQVRAVYAGTSAQNGRAVGAQLAPAESYRWF